MKIFYYLKNNGIKRFFEVLYQYKIDIFFQKIILFFVKNKPLKDIIIIESHNDFDCNGGAFYDYLITNQYNTKYKIVWLLKNDFCPKLPKNVTAVPLFKPSLKKDYYLCVAKYLNYDCNIQPKLRENQLLLHFSHGAANIKAFKGKVVMPNNLDYYLVPSWNYAPISAEQLNFEYPNDKFACLGYPMHDILYQQSTQSELKKVVDRDYDKVVLWMPTFRKGKAYKRNDSTYEFEMGIPLITNIEEQNELNNFLKNKNTLLIIKIHPMQDMSVVKIGDSSNIKILTGESVKKYGIDNYRLMKDVDALISDYSSVSFEFLHLNRPIGYVLCDEKQYKLGFVVENPRTLMAGMEIDTLVDLKIFINELSQNIDPYYEQRTELLNWVFKYTDGDSCKRIAEFMGLSNE